MKHYTLSLLILLTATATIDAEMQGVTLIRDLPVSALAGSNITVTLYLDVDESSPPIVVGISEEILSGWRITESMPEAIFNPNKNTLEWMIWKPDSSIEDQTIHYILQIPADFTGNAEFNGTLRIKEGDIITGDTTLIVEEATISTTSTTIPGCNLVGDYPPCGEVTLSEVTNLINRWMAGNARLSEVAALINAWSSVSPVGNAIHTIPAKNTGGLLIALIIILTVVLIFIKKKPK